MTADYHTVDRSRIKIVAHRGAKGIKVDGNLVAIITGCRVRGSDGRIHCNFGLRFLADGREMDLSGYCYVVDVVKHLPVLLVEGGIR